MFAPQPDGSAVTFWADAAKTAEGLKPRHAHDAAAYPAFDKKVRAVASFLAYINAITPPDAKSPSIADAIAGLKLGKAFRDLGAKTGREAIRALPMAVADLVAEVFEDEAIRGPLATRGVLYTVDGTVGRRFGGRVPDGLRRQRRGSARTEHDREGRERRARDARSRPARRRSASTIRTGADVAEIRSRDGRVVGVTLADGESIDAATVVSAADPKRTLRALRSGRARTDAWSGAPATSASRARPRR